MNNTNKFTVPASLFIIIIYLNTRATFIIIIIFFTGVCTIACNLANGNCLEAHNQCVCNEDWTGPSCEQSKHNNYLNVGQIRVNNNDNGPAHNYEV